MVDTSFKRDTCRMCGENDLELVMPIKPTPLADAYVTSDRVEDVQQLYPLDLYFCRSCCLVQLLGVVSPEVIYPDYIYETAGSLGLVEHFQKYADGVVNRLNAEKGSLVIDIGCNDGTLLKSFKNKGMRVLGVEPARDVSQKATEAGIDILTSFFTSELAAKIRDEYGPATIVTANNVFANIDDLTDIIKGIRGILAPDGVFIFETGYLADMIQGCVFDNIYHEHLCYFSVKPLEAFFKRNGMELIFIERVPTKGGSIRGIVQLDKGKRPVDSSVKDLIALENSLGFERTEVFNVFADRINSMKDQLLKLLNGLEAKGKTVAGYGASNSVTTMIYHFDLAEFISFLVDDNPIKQGRFSPGYHIPILSSEVIYEKKPDYLIILPWRFSKPIIKKHGKYLKHGGHFIVPIPEVEII